MVVECNLIEIEIYALGAGVDDCIRRGNMEFKFGEIPIRVIVANPLCVINYTY
jgi:hypothetical protein